MCHPYSLWCDAIVWVEEDEIAIFEFSFDSVEPSTTVHRPKRGLPFARHRFRREYRIGENGGIFEGTYVAHLVRFDFQEGLKEIRIKLLPLIRPIQVFPMTAIGVVKLIREQPPRHTEIPVG